MSEELKPCPFCGGEAELVRKATGVPTWALWCKNPDCFAGAVEVRAFEPERLVAAWNTRAERTCKPIDEFCCGVPSCGNCGVTLNMVTSGVRPYNQVLPNYCHDCGAKVVD